MDGMALPAGSGCDIDFFGEKLILDPLHAIEYGIVENHVIKEKLKRDPMEIAVKYADKLPAAIAEKLVARAYEDSKKEPRVTLEEILEFIESLDGLAFMAWLPLHKRYGDKVKFDRVREWVGAMPEGEIKKLKDIQDTVNGTHILGNSTGQTPTTTGTTENPGLADANSNPSDSGDTPSAS